MVLGLVYSLPLLQQLLPVTCISYRDLCVVCIIGMKTPPLPDPFSIPTRFHTHWRVSMFMRYLRFCRPFSDLKSPPLSCMSCPWTRAIPCTTLFFPLSLDFAHSCAFIVCPHRGRFHIAYRTNLKSFFFKKERVCAWALLFFLSTSFSRNPPTCIAYRTDTVTSLFFFLFPLLLFTFSLTITKYEYEYLPLVRRIIQ